MIIKEKKVLITGAGGFIGSHLVERILAEGGKVKAFIRYDSKSDVGWLKDLPEEKFRSIELFRGDLRELESVRSAMDGVEVVFHLGALVGIPYSYKNPSETIQTNIVGTHNVLVAARDVKVERIVVTSTSEVYGSARYIPIDEEHPIQPQSPYAASKVAADAIAKSYHLSYDLPVTILRPFNTFGPRQSLRAVIPSIALQALRGLEIKIGVTSTTRDFTYVSDTVDGFLKAVSTENAIGQVINLGTGLEVKIDQIVKKILKLTGSKKGVILDKIRVRPSASEVQRLCSNNEKARRILDWSPKCTLDTGLKKTLEWLRNSQEGCDAEQYHI